MIQDPRIGRRGPKGRIVQTPTQYVTGEGYVPAANPAPTYFWLDKIQEYFIILPVSLSRIKPETHAMFLKIVGKEHEIDFPYNDGSDETVMPRAQSVMMMKVEEDDEEDVPVKLSAAEINAQRKAKLLAELAALEEDETPVPKKTVKVVTSEKPAKTFELPSFNKKSTMVEAINDEDDEADAGIPSKPKANGNLGLVPKEPKPLKSTVKDQDSGIDPKKSNLVN